MNYKKVLLPNVVDNRIISIIGASSFAKEICSHIHSDLSIKREFRFFVDDQYLQNNIKVLNEYNVFPISSIDIPNSLVIVGVGDSLLRFNVVDRLSKDINYFSYIHSSCKILHKKSIDIGEGSIVCAGTIMTCDIKIGIHAQLNLNTTVGHDVTVGDFFTTAPGVNLSGNVKIGNRVYIGTNATIKNAISICNDVVIGMGACVVKDITIPGTYVGVPAKLIR